MCATIKGTARQSQQQNDNKNSGTREFSVHLYTHDAFNDHGNQHGLVCSLCLDLFLSPSVITTCCTLAMCVIVRQMYLELNSTTIVDVGH